MHTSNQLKLAKSLVSSLDKKLKVPRPWIYWMDFLISNVVLWVCVFAVIRSTDWGATAVGFVLATIFCFRVSTFVHEINHSAGKIIGFRSAYNLLFGYLFKMQVSLFANHAAHHNPRTFGTDGDPKYDHFGGKGISRLLRVFPEAALYVLKMNFRLAAWPWVKSVRLPSIVNPNYSTSTVSKPQVPELLFFWGMVFLCAGGVLPWKTLIVLNLLTLSVWLFDFIHLITAHRYSEFNRDFGLQDQIEDSYTIVGSWYTELWSPLGLRYHALHHMQPEIPYHSLGKVHELLVKHLPPDHFYLKTVRPSGFSVWRTYLSTAFSNSREKWSRGGQYL